MHVLGNSNILYLLFFLLIVVSLSGCSNKCYDAGQTSSSGTVSLEIPAVTVADPNTNGWIESDIDMSDSNDFPVTVSGFINVCPPIDSSDCSAGSDFCREGAFYPMRCDNDLSQNGLYVNLDDKGNMICSGSQVLSSSSFIFDIPVYPGDSIAAELIPIVDTAVAQQYSTTEVNCSCLSDGSCSATQDFLFYTPDYVDSSGTKILYKATDEGIDVNGNPNTPKCSDTTLKKEDIMQMCAYGDYFCMLDGGKKQSYYVSSLIAGGRQKLWHGSKFNEQRIVNGTAAAHHMPNFLAAGDSTAVNGGLLTDYRAGDLRGAGYAYANPLSGFKCETLDGGKKYNKQFSFYEANEMCSKAVMPNTKFSISSGSSDTVALPGTIYLDASDSSGYEKVSKLIANGYSNLWIPAIALNYHDSQPTNLGVTGTKFAPINADTGNYIGSGYPYKISGGSTYSQGLNEEDIEKGRAASGAKWVSVTANNSSSFKAKRGGMAIRIKRYCLHDNGENLYANVSLGYPKHKPGEDSTDIEMVVKTSVDANGITKTEPVIIPSGSGKVYFGIKNAKVGSASEVSAAKADNNVYVITYNKREWPTTISKPINALIEFVKEQLFGKSFSSEAGIIAPMYEVFVKKLYPLFAYGLTLYVSIYGIMWMSGMVHNVQQDLIMTVIKVAFLVVCLGTDSWNFLAYIVYSFFVEGVIEVLNSTVESIVYVNADFSFLDKTIGTLFDKTVVLRIFALMLSGPVGFIVFIIILHGLFEYVGAMFRFVLRYVMIIFAYGWLIFLAPLFALCLLFPITKDMFNSWLKLLVNFALQPLFMFTLAGMLNEIMLYSINKMLMFGICGNECVLYIKLGELGGQDVGFCLFSFFLPQGYDAAIPAAQYLTSATDPMTNLFGLPFGLTILFLFYLSTYCLGAFMGIAEVMAQTISSSMGSVKGAVASAEEGLKWLIGEDMATQGRIAQALRGGKDRGRDERQIETEELEDDAGLNNTNRNRATRQPIRASDDMEPRTIEGRVQGDGEALSQEAPPQQEEAPSKPEMPDSDKGSEKEESMSQRAEAMPEPQEAPYIPPPDYDDEPQEAPYIPPPDYDDEPQEAPDIPPPDYDAAPQEELSELEKKFREWGDEYHDVGHLREHADDASLAGSQTTDSLATEQVRESDYEDPVMKAIAERKAAEPEEKELSELEKKFREWGDEYHDVGHLKEHADDVSLAGSQTTDDSLATEQVRESDYEDPVMKAIAERKAAEPEEKELSELEKKFKQWSDEHPKQHTDDASLKEAHKTKDEDENENE